MSDMSDDEALLDEPVDEYSIEIGDLVEDSIEASGRDDRGVVLYNVEFELKGDMSSRHLEMFGKALKMAYDEPPMRASYRHQAATLENHQLRLNSVLLEEVESRHLPIARAAVDKANVLIKGKLADEQTQHERQKAENMGEKTRRNAFIEQMRKRKGSA
jgi:hypothetical protein